MIKRTLSSKGLAAITDAVKSRTVEDEAAEIGCSPGTLYRILHGQPFQLATSEALTDRYGPDAVDVEVVND